jgi:GT2 family glycosyltransferase
VNCNAGDNPLHPSGISVSGRYREPREYGEPREVAVTSGACWLIRRSACSALGGLTDELFLYYHDDVDLAWRARIAGLQVVYCPQATALHSYEFSRRPQKWFLLERNRLFSVLDNYELRTLLLLAPLLVATEVGVLVIAAIDGWWLLGKLHAYASLAGLHRRLRERRRLVRAIRRRSDAELLPLFSGRLDSPLLSARGAAVANFFCVPYLRIVRLLAR